MRRTPTLDDYKAMAARVSCWQCGAPSTTLVREEDREYGWEVQGFDKKQGFYCHCEDCGYGTSFEKLRVPKPYRRCTTEQWLEDPAIYWLRVIETPNGRTSLMRAERALSNNLCSYVTDPARTSLDVSLCNTVLPLLVTNLYTDVFLERVVAALVNDERIAEINRQEVIARFKEKMGRSSL
jgi:hypothetical protein